MQIFKQILFVNHHTQYMKVGIPRKNRLQALNDEVLGFSDQYVDSGQKIYLDKF